MREVPGSIPGEARLYSSIFTTLLLANRFPTLCCIIRCCIQLVRTVPLHAYVLLRFERDAQVMNLTSFIVVLHQQIDGHVICHIIYQRLLHSEMV